MPDNSLQFENVTFGYDTAPHPILRSLTLEIGPGWTGLIGANGTGKTTWLRLAGGELAPQQGRILAPGRRVLCAQRTDDPPLRLAEFQDAHDASACRLRGQLDIGWDWGDRWSTLSHGERKRAQLGVALWDRPDLLAVDEPTNHLDRVCRGLVLETLRGFRGVGLIVSHDRELLDTLCGQCLFFDPAFGSTGVLLRPGGYTRARGAIEQERESALRARDRIKKETRRLEREQADRAREAAQADRRRSKRGISTRDHDAKSRIDAARVSGKDGMAGRLQKQLDGRLEQTRKAASQIDAKRQRSLGLSLEGRRATRDTLLRLAPGVIEMGPGRVLRFPELTLRPGDRIAVCGPNGVGKSTLIRHVLDTLDLPEGGVVYVPQELDAAVARHTLEQTRDLPHDRLGQLMTIVASLGSDVTTLLQSETPSPGEVQKVMLGLGVLANPMLIVMDEPTNHLDLPAVECLEAALIQWPGALLMVSHDDRFLDRLTASTWRLERAGEADADETRVVVSERIAREDPG